MLDVVEKNRFFFRSMRNVFQQARQPSLVEFEREIPQDEWHPIRRLLLFDPIRIHLVHFEILTEIPAEILRIRLVTRVHRERSRVRVHSDNRTVLPCVVNRFEMLQLRKLKSILYLSL